MGEAPRIGVFPLAGRADAAVVGCWLAVGGVLLGIGTDVRRIVLVSRAIADPTQVPQASDADGPVALATILGLLTMLAALVLVGRWASRLRANVRALGGPVRAEAVPRNRAAVGAVGLVVLAVLLVRFALGGGETPQAVRTADWLDVATQALLGAVCFLGVLVVGRVTRAHEARVRGAGGFAAAPQAPEDVSTLRVRTEEDLRGSHADRP